MEKETRLIRVPRSLPIGKIVEREGKKWKVIDNTEFIEVVLEEVTN